jgi:DNA repair protein RecN (Recombination protein N)
LGYFLVDIHSQHQNLILNDENFQIKLVDVFSDQSDLLNSYSKEYQKFVQLDTQYKDLLNKSDENKADLDYLQFQYKQLDEAKLQADEQKELEEEIEILNHAGEIKSALEKTKNSITNDETGVSGILKAQISSLEKISSYSKKAEEYVERLNSVLIEIKDIADESELVNEGIEYLPSRMETVSQRLDVIYNLQQKHKQKDISGLLALKDNLYLKIININSYDSRILETRKDLEIIKSKLEGRANNISKNRKAAIPDIENTIIKKLNKLGIPHAGFMIKLFSFEEFLPNGRDKVEFMFSANKKTNLQEVSRVASGGEISRLMLSIKSLITTSTALPTIIFDEIDSGISGEIADKMGDIIKEMSKDVQVINITHLPQIARKGDFHYLVYKYEDSDNTYTDIKLLEMEDRIIEIAKMLSGSDLTDLTLKTARELLINEQKN